MSSEEENNCFICWSSLDEKEFGRKKIIHNHEGSHDKWEHSCHEKCLNSWCKRCITVEGVYPKCPICVSFKIPIEKMPVSFRQRALELIEEEEEEEEEEKEEEEVEEEVEEVEEQQIINVPKEVYEADKRLKDIRQNQTAPLPFLGIMVCFNGRTILKYTNSNFNLTINSSLDELKAGVLSKNVEISTEIGLQSLQNISHNLNLINWINWTYPTFKITDVHYGIPPYTCRFEPLDSEFDLTKNVSMSDIYLEYQRNAGRILDKQEILDTAPLAHRHLSKLYYREGIYKFEPTGPDDREFIVRAYKNYQNPYIEDRFCYQNGRFGNQTTYDPLSWLVVHVDF